MTPLRRVDAGAVSPMRSQALYHGLAAAMDEATPDTLVLCRPDRPYFCVGYHQTAEEVLDLARCRRAGWPVLRRRIGGGAVYLDGRQLFYQIVVHRTRAPFAVREIYRRFLTPPVLALRRLGLEATLRGVNEIEVRGRRIAGTGGGMIGEAVVVVGNVLFGFPRRRMSRAWKSPSGPFRRLADAGLRRYLTTLRAELGTVPPMAVFGDLLATCYAEHLGQPVASGGLTAREEARVAEAGAEVASEAFVFERGGVPSRGGVKIVRGVSVWEATVGEASGPIRLAVRLRHGTIDAAAVAGRRARQWARALEGAVLDRETLLARVGGVSDGVDGEEVVEALLALGRRAAGIG